MYNEENIIKSIVKNERISISTINDFLCYLNIIGIEHSNQFDIHCELINNLCDDDFNKYIKSLSINYNRKSM